MNIRQEELSLKSPQVMQIWYTLVLFGEWHFFLWHGKSKCMMLESKANFVWTGERAPHLSGPRMPFTLVVFFVAGRSVALQAPGLNPTLLRSFLLCFVVAGRGVALLAPRCSSQRSSMMLSWPCAQRSASNLVIASQSPFIARRFQTMCQVDCHLPSCFHQPRRNFPGRCGVAPQQHGL